jgi:hypothetical protein
MSDDRRYYGLDALRGGMMLLGVVLHSAVFYIAVPPPHLPVTTDPSTSLAMDGLTKFIHSFRMPCFFVVSGFFTALLVEKRGLAGMYRKPGRAHPGTVRGGPFHHPAADAALSPRLRDRRALWPDGVAPVEERPRTHGGGLAGARMPQGLPVLHLWFLMYLCYFYLLVPFCQMLVRWSLPFEARLTRALGSPFSLPLLIVATALTLWPFLGAEVFGDFIFLGFSPSAFAYYGFFFVVGYIYHHYRAATANLVRYVRGTAILAAILFPLTIYATHLEYTHPGAELGYHVLAVTVHAACTWTLIWLFVGAALRWFDRPTPWAVYASNSAYWVFLLHLPVICCMAWLLVPMDAHALVKFGINTTVTTVVCFVTYHYGVQNTWIGAFLHGRRFKQDWPWRPL